MIRLSVSVIVGDDKNKEIQKVKKIIYKLGNEDETISQKIILSEIKNRKKRKKKATQEEYDYDDLELEDDENE